MPGAGVLVCGMQELRGRNLDVLEPGHLCTLAFHLAQSHDGTGGALDGLHLVGSPGGETVSANRDGKNSSSHGSHVQRGKGRSMMRRGGAADGMAGAVLGGRKAGFGVFDAIAAEIEGRNHW